LRTFGFLRKINRGEFLTAIEEPSSVFVIVHLYQDYVPACVSLNKALQTLAIENAYIKFLKILSTDAIENFDDLTLPSLVVYQGGNLFRSFVRITDYLGAKIDVEKVEQLLKKEQILD